MRSTAICGLRPMGWSRNESEPLEPCWSPRGIIGGGAVMNGRIWILGGGRYDTPKVGRLYHNDVWSSADGIHWTEHTKAAPGSLANIMMSLSGMTSCG